MTQKNFNPKRLSPGDNVLSAGTWNGLVQDYEDRRRTTKVEGDPLNRPVPPVLRGSTIVLASLREGEESISGFTPVRISKINRGKDAAYALPYYEVQAVDSVVGNGVAGYERAYQYGFTMGEGVSKESGGRIVIAGTAIVAIPSDKFMKYASGGFIDSPSGALYYVVDDLTLMDEAYYQPMSPVGHFRFLGYISDSNSELESLVISDWADNKSTVFMAVDMSPASQTFVVDLGSLAIAPLATGSSKDEMQSDVGTVVMTHWSTSDGDMESMWLTDDVDGAGDSTFVRVFNPTNRVATGRVTVQFSEAYNRFIVFGGTEATFQIEMTQVGGEQGTSSAPASWTYNVKEWEGDDSILKAGVDPVESPSHYRRPNAGQLSKATFGTATYNAAGELVIIDCNETLIFTTC